MASPRSNFPKLNMLGRRIWLRLISIVYFIAFTLRNTSPLNSACVPGHKEGSWNKSRWEKIKGWMRISLSRCTGVQRQCCSGVTDRFTGKVITEKVEGKFRFQGRTTADSYSHRSSHTANNTQHGDWNTLKQFCAFYLCEMCFRNGQTKHSCTSTHL